MNVNRTILENFKETLKELDKIVSNYKFEELKEISNKFYNIYNSIKNE